MINHNTLLRSIVDATAEVFSTMLDMRVQHTGVASEGKAPEHGIVSLVGITGEWGGSGVFSCTPVLARIVCTRMLGTKLDASGPSIDDDVLDVVAEITNMLIGNVKNGLEEVTGPLAISVPTVIYGRNFRFRCGSGLRALTVCFAVEEERFEVRLSLAPATKQSSNRPRIPVLGLAHV